MATLRDNIVEAIVGLLVVLLAVWFFVFAWQRTGGGMEDSIRVTALFPAANGVSIGTDVKLAGLKVGSVAGQRLDPETYKAEVKLAIDEDVSIPPDSSDAITAEGLLGGTFIVLLPGGSATLLKGGALILNTQGSGRKGGVVGKGVLCREKFGVG